MSFRLRVLVMLVFVAVTASGTTAWLAFDQTTRQVRQIQAANEAETARVTAGLRNYGLTHGTWVGVSSEVIRLAQTTGQRIRILADDGTLTVDSDELLGRVARATVGPPVLVDPRPEFAPSGITTPYQVVTEALQTYRAYRSALPFQACLTKAGSYRPWTTDLAGRPQVVAVDTPAECRKALTVPLSDEGLQTLIDGGKRCMAPGPGIVPCVAVVFRQAITPVAARPVQMYVGAVDERNVLLDARPVVGLASVVAVLVMLAAVLIVRRPLTTVRALTAAAGRLGAGDLDQRVPVSGRDEIAQLGRTFNRMAASLQAVEENERRMIADIAHELRSPLANLLGYLEALKDGVLDPSPELLESLHEEAALQQRIVADLQMLALAEAGALTYHLCEVDAADLLAGLVTAHAPAVTRAGVDLAADADPGLVVNGDPDRLRQALGNLINNAVRATPAGGSVKLRARPWDGGEVAIEVTDTGGGIRPDELPHIFDRFWRADRARSRSTGGSGLGLAIVRQIVLGHRGRIDVTSEAGVGTTFTIVLPAGVGSQGCPPQPGELHV